MNKKIKLISLILVLGVLIGFALSLKKEATLIAENPHSDFAVKDTASIVKFRISDTDNNEITITRENGLWMIGNTGFKAQQSTVDLLLETFFRIKVKQDLPEGQFETIVSQLMVRHKKVEIFTKDDLSTPHKTWYIGNSTSTHLGTYMLLQKGKEKSSIPFITEKAGIYGSLEVRFFTNFADWRSTQVFGYNPKLINKICLKHSDPALSFTAVRIGENQVSLLDNTGMPTARFDSALVKHYFTHYKNIHYEGLNTTLYKNQVDSILAIPPDYDIVVTDHLNKERRARLWKIRMPEGHTDDNDIPQPFDPERAWCALDEGMELMKVQYYSWDILLKPINYFTQLR